MKARAWLLIGAIVLGMAGTARAQDQPSLAEVARREAERRKATGQPKRVYTNADVKATTAPVSTAAALPPSKDQAADQAASGGAQIQPGKPPDEPAKDEAYWRQRITQAREQLSRSKLFAEALQSRINALTTDFVNRDDPYQREQIARQRQEALAELDRVNRDIDAQSKAIADIEEEARRTGVPPGWVR
jgi:hypothetical protein